VAIALAGPGAGFTFAALLYAGLRAAGYAIDVGVEHSVLIYVRLAGFELAGSWHLAVLVNDLFFICVYWGIINLLPIYPLDGGQISRRLLVLVDPRGGVRSSLVISIVTAGVVAAVGLVRLRDWWIGLFFVYLAANSYAMLKYEDGPHL
jgi:Zn-dependent protease